MYNRWIHICQAIDFKTSKITTVVNGFVSDDIPADKKWPYVSPYYQVYNESNPLGRIETITNNFVIGLRGDAGSWSGK